MKFRDGTFDIVFNTVIEHFDDDRINSILCRVIRVTKRRKIVVLVPSSILHTTYTIFF